MSPDTLLEKHHEFKMTQAPLNAADVCLLYIHASLSAVVLLWQERTRRLVQPLEPPSLKARLPVFLSKHTPLPAKVERGFFEHGDDY